MADGAREIIEGFLGRYGLGALADWAWTLYLETGDIEQIKLALPQQPAFKQRFPAYEALAQQGRAISPDQYISYENEIKAITQQYGIPRGMYDTPDAIADLMLNDVSASEARQRAAIAADAAFKAPQEVRDALSQRFGISEGSGLVGYFLDPDRATPLLEQAYASAQVEGAARRQQVTIGLETADRLAAQGVTYQQALSGFGQVVGMGDLSNAEQGGQAVSQDNLVKGVFGDAEQQQQIEKEAGRRAARYRASEGGAASSQTGVSGLRSASS